MLSVRFLGVKKESQISINSIKIQGNLLIFLSHSISIDPRNISSIINAAIDRNRLFLTAKRPSCKLIISDLPISDLNRILCHILEIRRNFSSITNNLSAEPAAISSEGLGSELTVSNPAAPQVDVELIQPSDASLDSSKRILEEQETVVKKRKIMPYEPELPSIEMTQEKPAELIKEMKIFNHMFSDFQGFVNMGNTCYLNSILIALMFNKQLLGEITLSENTVLLEMNSLFRKKIQSASSEMPRSFKQELDKQTDLFKGYEQHDAHELLTQLVDITKLEHLFNVELHKTLKCENNHESNSKERSLGLSINCNGSILEGIQDLLKSEQITYKCDECNSTSSRMRYQIVKLPGILCLHLKRFKIDLNFNISKILESIVLNKTISISNCKYELYGIVNHFGKYGTGHYTTAILIDDKWVVFDDEKVYINYENQNVSGYVLFYNRK
eukprot:NODE_77_length_23338_cov_0.319463.p5 type:complete len:443 gc:universal NODE_77_length_23338_cov_0.319463:20817-19489(-)